MIRLLKYFFIASNFCLIGCSEKNALDMEINRLVYDHYGMYKDQVFCIDGIGSSCPENFNYILIDYKSNISCDINMARQIIVPMNLSLVKLMNESKEISKYVVDSQLNSNNAHIGVHFVDKNFPYQLPPMIAYVLIISNKVIYYQYDLIKRDLFKLYSESFEDAQFKLKNS